jgi:PRTRC genetic system ThiF family protein
MTSTNFTFDTPTLLRLQVPRFERVSIRLIGCGGTGSHLATGLGVLARELIDCGKPCDLAFIDGDRVEAKNVGRQLFSAGDVGRYKAEVLARRVGAAYNLPALAVSRHVTTAAELAPKSSEWDTLHLVIGAVDNPAARAHLAGAVKEARGRLWALDAGNENHSGQVIVGNTADAKLLRAAVGLGMLDRLPSPYLVSPDLVAVPKAVKRAASCAEAAAEGSQGLMVNRMMAAWALAMLHDLLLGALNYFAVWVNLETGGVRTWPLDLPSLSEASGLSHKELEQR